MEEESSSGSFHPQSEPEVEVFGICIGSKTVLRYDCSENICLQCGISCALSDKAVPNHVLFGSVDFPHPIPVITSGKIDSQNSASNAGATSGFLRCIDDPEGHLKDLSSLRRFIGIPGKSPIFLVPTPLSIESREKLLNVVMGEEEAVHLPPSPRKLFNFTEAISLAFLHSSEGKQALHGSEGRIQLLIVEIGEDYSCASFVQVELVHDHHNSAAAIADRNPTVIDSQTNQPSLRSVSFPVERLNLSVLASEGHLGFGYHEMDEILLQDWLAILYHLAKSMRLKKVDTSMRLSKEALEGHNKLQAGETPSSSASEMPDEAVNVVEGFRWWLKLSPSSRSRCLRAMHIFRLHNGGDRNAAVKATEYDRLLVNHSFMKQLAAAETFDEEVEFLAEFLLDECDAILQSLTSWVSFQSAKVLKQLLAQYGHEKIAVDVQVGSVRSGDTPKLKQLIIDGRRDVIIDEDQHSQNDTSSMAGTIYYESYSRPMLRSHIQQLVKSLKLKLRILPADKDFSGDRQAFPRTSETPAVMLLWNEVSINDEDIGHGAVNRILFEEVRREMSILRLPNGNSSGGEQQSHHSPWETYSCGPSLPNPASGEEATDGTCLAYHLPSRLILQGISPLTAWVAAAAAALTSPGEVVASPLYRHLTLTENVSTAAWCGNLGFSLIYEEKRKAHHQIDVAPENVIWLTDFSTSYEQLQPFQRKRLATTNPLVLKMDIQDAHRCRAATATSSSDYHRQGMDGSLSVYLGHVEELDARNHELSVVLKRMSHVIDDSREEYFFQPCSPTMQFQGDEIEMAMNTGVNSHRLKEAKEVEKEQEKKEEEEEDTRSLSNEAAVAEPSLQESGSNIHAMVTFELPLDRCGSISVHCSDPHPADIQLPHDVPVAATAAESTHVDDSLVSSTSVHSTDLSTGHLSDGHSLHSNNNNASHLVNHEQQHRRMHYFYQRSNRHRRDHTTTTRHHHHLLWPSSASSHHHLHHPQLSHAHHHGHVSHHHSDSSIHQHPHQHPHSPGHSEPRKKEYHWKLVVVRSASFYTVSNMAHAALMADSDSEAEDGDPALEASRLHETMVQEDVHIVHAVDLQQQEAWTVPFHQVQYVSLEIDANGIISVNARPLMTKAEMIARFPCSPTPPELALPPPPTEAEQAAKEKAEEIVAIKRELLSLIPPLSRYLEDEAVADDALRPNLSQRRAAKGPSTPPRPMALSPKASRMASMTFGALLFLYLAFLVFVVTQAVSLWFPGTWSTPTSTRLPESLNCEGSDVCVATEVVHEGYSPALAAFWAQNCSDVDDATTHPPSSQQQSLNCPPDSSGDQSVDAFPFTAAPQEAETNGNSCQRQQQMIFAAASPLARLRYTIRRLRQNVTKTLDYVRFAVVYTITRFPFGFRAS